VQKFIGEEHQALTYDPRYLGMYDSRFIDPGDLDDLFHPGGCEVPAATVVEQRHAALYAGALPKRAAAFVRHREEWDRVVAFRRELSQEKDKKVVFRGRKYGRRDVNGLLEFIEEDLEKDRRKLASHDGEILLVHSYMSRQLGQPVMEEFRERYTFHLKLQAILGALFRRQAELESILAIASGAEGDGHEQIEFQEVFLALRQARDVLIECLEKADKLRLPPLVHMKAGKRLGPFLWDEPVVRRFRWSGQSISGKQVQKLMDQLGKVIDRGQRIHFKSLGGILTLQEEIGRQWLSKFAGHSPQATGRGQ
jgi:hypothetical protein